MKFSKVALSARENRRPIRTRSTAWAQFIARRLVRIGLSANQISLAGLLFAFTGAGLLMHQAIYFPSALFLIGVAICIQLRLLANMMDGLVAVEGNQQTKTGELFNEIPDRIADLLFLATAGYACRHGEIGEALGWSAAALALMTAYIRALGANRGWPQDFSGPQAKPHRMFLLTVGCLLAAVEVQMNLPPYGLFVSLIVITTGTFITCVRRTINLASQLEAS